MDTISLKIAFICAGNHDRSPDLEKYFKENHHQHEYKSAGVNRYFTTKNNSKYINVELIQWADLLVFAEKIHMLTACKIFGSINKVTPNNAFIMMNHRTSPDGCDGTIETSGSVFAINNFKKRYIVLDCGEYNANSMEDYILKAESIIENAINRIL